MTSKALRHTLIAFALIAFVLTATWIYLAVFTNSVHQQYTG